MQKTPKCVVLADIHYNLNTLHIADYCVRKAIEHASQLKVPLIFAGDTHDTKAMLRGECVNKLIDTLVYADSLGVKVYVLIGNHDLINQKGTEHSLNFLTPYADIIKSPVYLSELDLFLIPYQASSEDFLTVVKSSPTPNLLVHQGCQSGNMGHYFKDESAVDPSTLPDGLRVVSGHYHLKHDISLPGGGVWSYIGNLYSLTFGEAKDGPKGFCVLYNDGSLKQVPISARKHVVSEKTTETLMDPILDLNPEDYLWLKVTGPYLELEKINKKEVGDRHLGHSNFKLDKIYTDKVTLEKRDTEKLSNSDILDKLIDETEESEASKTELKALWRSIL